MKIALAEVKEENLLLKKEFADVTRGRSTRNGLRLKGNVYGTETPLGSYGSGPWCII